MAGNLDANKPTQFTSVSIGSGHSVGGSDRTAGSPIYAFAGSVVTVVQTNVPNSSSVSTAFPFVGFGTSDIVNMTRQSQLSVGLVASFQMLSQDTGVITYVNTSLSTITQTAAAFTVYGIDITA